MMKKARNQDFWTKHLSFFPKNLTKNINNRKLIIMARIEITDLFT